MSNDYANSYVIEVQSEGWPSVIGPFHDRAAAFAWMEGRSLDGSWNIAPVTNQWNVDHLGKP